MSDASRSLPPELWKKVLDHSDVRDRFELMSADSDLCQFVLEDGPFPRDIEKIDIRFNFSGKRIDILSRIGGFWSFIIYSSHFTIVNSPGDAEDGYARRGNMLDRAHYPVALSLMSETITNVRELTLDYTNRTAYTDFPFARLRFVENFYIKGHFLEQCQEVFDQMHKVEITNCFFDPYLDATWAPVQGLNIEFLYVSHRRYDQFFEATNVILKEGIPSRHRHASVCVERVFPKYLYDPNAKDDFEAFQQTFEKQKDLAALDENSKEAKLFIDYFAKKAFDRVSWKFIETLRTLKYRRFFKKRLENGKLCVFLVIVDQRTLGAWDYKVVAKNFPPDSF